MLERLQKVMAAAGVASRRACERMIEEGRVKVNGEVATLGSKVEDKDRITVDGKPVGSRHKEVIHRVLIYNKPAGEVTTRNDPEGRTSVFAGLPRIKSSRWIGIGRLDISTTGLLLFTTDGELAHRLMHPSYMIERKYAVRVLGKVTADMFRELKSGVELEDGLARFLTIEDSGGTGVNHWYHVTLAEGRNREVRRLWEAVGLKVSRLMRINYAGIALPSDLKVGKYQDLVPAEMESLYKLVKMETPEQIRKIESKKRPVRQSARFVKPQRKESEISKRKTNLRNSAAERNPRKTAESQKKKLRIKRSKD